MINVSNPSRGEKPAPPTLLDAVLLEESEPIIHSWAVALHSMSHSTYAERSLAELRVTCSACFLAYQEVIQQHDHGRLRQFIGDIVQLRSAQGFSLVEMQRAFLTAKAIVRPRLLARYAAQPDVVAFAADWLRFENTVDLALLRFTEQYHRTEMASKDRQLARVNNLSRQLMQIATHDELTDLYNFRYFEEHLLQEVERAARYHRPLSLLMGDLDHFKAINDTYGHPVGNEVLQAVAATIRALLRTGDVAARYGGEEIAVILAETTERAAQRVAEKLRAAVAAGLRPDLPAVTLSFGVAQADPADADGSALVVAADNALYAAKQAGRNCVRTARKGARGKRTT
ncbi:MAG: diguanylate cyclase [Chloroflexota bacterium]|nr:diguanylate cyclase [Chloroflexota bacterium]